MTAGSSIAWSMAGELGDRSALGSHVGQTDTWRDLTCSHRETRPVWGQTGRGEAQKLLVAQLQRPTDQIKTPIINGVSMFSEGYEAL